MFRNIAAPRGPALGAWLVVAACLAPSAASGQTAETVEGFTEPYREVHLSAAEPGVVTDVSVGEGETVEEGRILAVLDLDVLEASLAVARQRAAACGRLDAATAELRMRRDRVEKLRGLRDRGHSSQSELDKAETDAAIAEAGVRAAEEEREIYRLECRRIEAQIDRRKIRSPIDGVVARVHKQVGEAILANDPQVITLIRLDTLRIRFPVPSAQANRLSAGRAVLLHFPETDQRARGTIEVVAPFADAKSGTVEVTVVLENPGRHYRSGMRCIASFSPDRKKPSDSDKLAYSVDGKRP